MGNFNLGGVVLDTEQFGVDTKGLDLSDRSSRVAYVYTANASLITLVGIFVGFRIFVRSYFLRRIFLDDGFILVAAGFTIALASVCLLATAHGLGTHIWLLPLGTVLQDVKDTIQNLFVCQVLYACAIAFTKIAIIASYLRFIHERKFRLTMYATGIAIGGLWMTGIFVTIFQCRPIAGAWDVTIQDRQCLNFVNYLYASSTISVATDLILCVLPWPYIWKLRMPIKQKVVLCILLAGGAGASVAGILRISQLHTLRSVDVTYQPVSCLILSVIECSLGIICVSVPSLRPAVVRLFPTALVTRPASIEKSPLHHLSRNKRATIGERPFIRLKAQQDNESEEANLHQNELARQETPSAADESIPYPVHRTDQSDRGLPTLER